MAHSTSLLPADEKASLVSSGSVIPDKNTLQVTLEHQLFENPQPTFSPEHKMDVRHAVMFSNVSPVLVVKDSQNAVRAPEPKQKTLLVSPSHTQEAMLLCDGRIIECRYRDIRLIGTDNQIQAQSYLSMCRFIIQITPVNQNEFLIYCELGYSEPTVDNEYPIVDEAHPEVGGVRRIFLLPKNQLAAWINQRCHPNPKDIQLTELIIPDFTYLNAPSELVVPKDNIIVYYHGKLKVYEITRNEKGLCQLIWEEPGLPKKDKCNHTLSVIRPGFFAVTAMRHSPNAFDLQFDEWDLEEIICKAKISNTAEVTPYRTSLSDTIFVLSNYEFLEDGRSVVSVKGKRVFIHDLEKPKHLPHSVIVNETENSDTTIVSDIYRRDGQHFVVIKENAEHTVLKVSFPLAERRCKEIPAVLQASEICNLPPEIARITTEYLGMFSRRNTNQQSTHVSKVVEGQVQKRILSPV